MLIFTLITIYLIIALSGIFILTPWLKANGKIGIGTLISKHIPTDFIVITFLFWPILGPFVLTILIGNKLLVKPGIKLFDKMVDYFEPKPRVKILPPVDERKSSYRQISYKQP